MIEQLRVATKILKPGGRVMVLQPNIRLSAGRYWDFIDHKVALTERSLVEAAELAGFQTEALVTRFLPYTTKGAFRPQPRSHAFTCRSRSPGGSSESRRSTLAGPSGEAHVRRRRSVLAMGIAKLRPRLVPRRSRIWQTTLAVSFVIAATLLELGRQSGIPAWHSLWAEDGQVFLQDAIDKPFAATLFEPVAGYMNLVPRLMATIVSAFPLIDAAWLVALMSSMIVALVALFVYDESRTIIRDPRLRFVVAISVILLPAEAWELTANLTNLHWYLLFACFWAVISDLMDRRRLVTRAVVAFVAPLCDPLAVLLLPVAVRSYLIRRRRASLVVPAALIAGLAVQGLVVLEAPAAPARTSAFHLEDLPAIFGFRVAGSLLIGDRFLDIAWRALGQIFAYGALLTLGLILLWLIRQCDRPRRDFALVCLVEALAFFVIELSVRGTASFGLLRHS